MPGELRSGAWRRGQAEDVDGAVAVADDDVPAIRRVGDPRTRTPGADLMAGLDHPRFRIPQVYLAGHERGELPAVRAEGDVVAGPSFQDVRPARGRIPEPGGARPEVAGE